ncbi:glycosyl transferase, partial [Pseudomonas syringae pv. tagetis]
HHLSAAIALATETSQAVVAHLTQVLYHRSQFAAASPEQAEPSSQRLTAIAWMSESLATGANVTQVPHFPSLLRTQWP